MDFARCVCTWIAPRTGSELRTLPGLTLSDLREGNGVNANTAIGSLSNLLTTLIDSVGDTPSAAFLSTERGQSGTENALSV